MTTQEKLRAAAAQLEEDAQGCWGIRRKLNLRSAAKIMRDAATMLDSMARREEDPNPYISFREQL